MTRRSISLLLVLGLAACDAPEGAPAGGSAPGMSEAPASFVSLLPTPDPNSLRFRLNAPPDHPLYLENCNGAFSWGLESSTWGRSTPVWTAATDACHSPPIVITSGSARDFAVELLLREDEQLNPGSYRLAVYGLYRIHDESHVGNVEVPHQQRLSEAFELAR